MEYFRGFKSDSSVSDEHVEEVMRMMKENNSKIIEFPGTYNENITTKNVTEENKEKIQNKFDMANLIKTKILPILIAGGIGFGSMAAYDKLHDDSKYAPDPNTKTVNEFIDEANEVKSNGEDFEVSEDAYQDFATEDVEENNKGGKSL